MSDKLTLEELDFAIRELAKDIENLCLYYDTKCALFGKCNGYSSVLICPIMLI